MKQIKILGSGCPKCNQLMSATEQAAESMGLDSQIEKITDMMRFADFGVMVTPALIVDGEIKSSGKVPTQAELQELLK